MSSGWTIRSASRAAALAAFVVSGAAQSVTIDFDALVPGDQVTTLAGVTFGSSTGLDLIASNVFDADTGDNYLGVDDGGLEVFLPSLGDVITLQFASPVVSLTAAFVSTPGPPDATYAITTAVGGSSSALLPDATLGDGGEVFRVTFASATPFTSADLSGGIAGLHSFNVDTIVFELAAAPVPAPGTLAMLALALPALAWRRRAQRAAAWC